MSACSSTQVPKSTDAEPKSTVAVVNCDELPRDPETNLRQIQNPDLYSNESTERKPEKHLSVPVNEINEAKYEGFVDYSVYVNSTGGADGRRFVLIANKAPSIKQTFRDVLKTVAESQCNDTDYPCFIGYEPYKHKD